MHPETVALHAGWNGDPATHSQLSEEEMRRTGLPPELIRLSIGIEHIDDIIADLSESLAAI